MPELVWSLADTHCVWCGKPRCEHSSTTGQCTEVWDAVELVGELRALVEAQAAVIARLRDGWRCVHPEAAVELAPERGVWRRLSGRKTQPMSVAEQVVYYGGVVRTEEAARDD